MAIKNLGFHVLGHFGKQQKERTALMKTMMKQLVAFERIETTYARTKALKRLADKMVTLAKRGTEKDYNKALKIIRCPNITNKLFIILGPRYKDRHGGYTRVLKTRRRISDAAPMAYIEFIDREGELRPPLPARTPIHKLQRDHIESIE